MSQLDKQTFTSLVASAPLVSIDLIVRNSLGQLLLGKRVNRPAQGFWFAPGGRVLKDEYLADAFKRLTFNELGVALDINQARYLGLYEHHYADASFCEHTSTHYIANGFEVELDIAVEQLPKEQHTSYLWLTEQEFVQSERVHPYCKWYLDNTKGFL